MSAREAPSWREGPEWGVVSEVAEMVALAGRSLRGLVTGPFTWIHEFVEQCALIVRRCLVPVALATAAFIFGAGVIVAGQLLQTIGATDRMGLGVAVASLREFASWITAMVVGGVGGTAICADLGARRVREEIEALETLGVDPRHSLILPRLFALTATMPVLYLWSALWGAIVPALVAPRMLGLPAGVYLHSYANLLTVDLWMGLLRMTTIGFVAGVVFCLEGYATKGGTAGVGRGVNRAVVVAFVAVWVVNLLFNTVFQAAIPDAQNLR